MRDLGAEEEEKFEVEVNWLKRRGQFLGTKKVKSEEAFLPKPVERVGKPGGGREMQSGM